MSLRPCSICGETHWPLCGRKLRISPCDICSMQAMPRPWVSGLYPGQFFMLCPTCAEQIRQGLIPLPAQGAAVAPPAPSLEGAATAPMPPS